MLSMSLNASDDVATFLTEPGRIALMRPQSRTCAGRRRVFRAVSRDGARAPRPRLEVAEERERRVERLAGDGFDPRLGGRLELVECHANRGGALR